MAVMVKVQCRWDNYEGGPGYTNWYGISDGDAAAAATALAARQRTFFAAIATLVPADVALIPQRQYQVLESLTGNITQEGSLATAPTGIAGTATGNYSAAVGAVINWETGQYNAKGHKLRGRSYLVPLAASAYNVDGSLSTASVTTITNAATAALGGTGSLVCWSRPVKEDGVVVQQGQMNIVTSGVCHIRGAVLRSRRD